MLSILNPLVVEHMNTDAVSITANQPQTQPLSQPQVQAQAQVQPQQKRRLLNPSPVAIQQQQQQPNKRPSVTYKGKYQIGKDVTLLPYVLGEGAHSKVLRAVNKEGKKFACKLIMKKDLLPHQLEELRNEVDILFALNNRNPNIASLLGYREDEDSVQLLFDQYHCSLLDICCENGVLPEYDSAVLISQVLHAVSFLHHFSSQDGQYDGICHRDLKLENIMLAADGSKLLLIDFGFSTFLRNKERLTKQCGSFHYVAPEIVKRLPYDGRKVDIWALGCILYAMVVGRQPFDSKHKEDLFDAIKKGSFYLPEKLSPELKDLLKGMLEVNPTRRLSIEEVRNHSWFRVVSKN